MRFTGAVAELIVAFSVVFVLLLALNGLSG